MMSVTVQDAQTSPLSDMNGDQRVLEIHDSFQVDRVLEFEDRVRRETACRT